MNQDTQQITVHQLVADLRSHKAVVYWFDLAICLTVLWGGLLWACMTQHVGLVVGLALAASFALYRAALFSHEISHFGKGTLPGFTLVWNALCGVPLLMPSFMLRSHVDHHRTASYGTANDPEYLPFAAYPQLKRSFWLGSALVPVSFMIRSCVVVPVAWFSPRMRRWLRGHMSFLVMNNAFRPSSAMQELSRFDKVCEAGCTVWIYGLLGLMASQLVPWRFGALLLLCMTVANLVNAWRTLATHRYALTCHTMNGLAQAQDSSTFTLPAIWGELVCPVGQRFHAAHHLLPYLPYHSLAQAHQRLLAVHWPGRDMYLQSLRQ